MPTIFISDVKYRMAVPAIRAFGQAGFRVVALEYDDTRPAARLGFHSRYTAQTLLLPREEQAFCAALEQAATAEAEKPVLMAFGRHTLGVLSRNPQLREFVDFLVPGPQSLETADNKHVMLHLAKNLDIPIPVTATSGEYDTLDALAESMPMPCVIKYRNGEALGLHASQRYRIVENRDDFRRVYDEMQARQPAPLAQEYVPGDGLGASLVLDEEGQLVDFICHRRIREYPVSGGPSSCCEAIFSRPMLKMALKLLRSVYFTGVAMVEFKGTPEQPILMEINPRFWGSSPLIYAAGSSFYASVAAAAAGRATALDADTCQPTYELGRRMRFFPQDLLAFPAYLRRRDGRALGCLRDVFNPHIRDGLFSLSDPGPFFRYLFCSRT